MTSMLSKSIMPSQMAQEELDQGAAFLDQYLLVDKGYLDLTDQLQVQGQAHPTVSGLVELDYPLLADPRVGLGALKELADIKKVPLPAELVEQFGHMQCNCMMGIFPEISRAWLSIDSDIFVWNYEDGTDLAYFDGLSETILCAGLVKPKQSIFQPHIQYLLCLATPVDIVLLGVSFSKPFEALASVEYAFTEMHLLPEPLFSLPTDNVHFLSVAGTENGRIFLAGKDCCLYELTYQAQDGWFSRKCRKINHSQSTLSVLVPSFLNFSFVDDDPMVQISIDDSRHILYCRTEKGTIQVYDLGVEGKGLSKVACVSQHNITQHAAVVARTIDRSTFYPIVHIAAIPTTDSNNIHLVAITHAGVRLYFSTRMYANSVDDRPRMLSLVHVRLPPGFTASSPPQRPSKVHASHYNKGTLLMCGSQSEDNDLLWTITSDAFPFHKQLSETHEMTGIDGRTWAMAEVPSSRLLANLEPAQKGMAIRADPPLVVTQHMTAKRKFILINSQGSYILTKQQPVDQLRQQLLSHGPDSPDVKAYFKLHKEQACATCLVLACDPDSNDSHVIEMATTAFFLHGGEPEYNFNASAGMGGKNMGPSTLGPNLSSTIGAGFQSPGGQSSNISFATPGPGMQPHQMSTPYQNVTQALHFQSPGSTSMAMATGPEVLFSGKHCGLLLYLGRLLRPLWEWRMVSDNQVQTNQGQKIYLSSQFSSTELSWILKHLISLRDFLERNSQFTSPILGESFAASYMSQRLGGSRTADGVLEDQMRKKYQVEADAQESRSLKQVQQLVTHVCESLGLWNVLCDHQLHVIAGCLTKDQQNSLRNMTFRDMVVAGKEISGSLITCLINMYIDDNAATDAISTKLRQICPSLYSCEDAVCSKANEKLKAAKSNQNMRDRENMLEEALQMFKQITTQLDLPTVSNHFGAVHFYRGIVDLTLTAAEHRDPQGLALHFYKNGEPPEDLQGLHAHRARMECYKCITETLDYLLSTSMSLPQATSVPRSPGPPPAADPNRLTNTEAERYAEDVFDLALCSEDEMFHVAFYEWLINKNLSEKLLEIQSPYLEPFLKRSTSQQPERLAMLDLLWKYYEKIKDYSAASRILAKLADGHGIELNLKERMEYLSRACMCAKSSTLRTTGATEGQFLHQLEEKMEVVRLQLQLHDVLVSLRSVKPDAEEALVSLNAQLLDITALYGEFADRFDLSECKLAIIHCAGHHDPTLVESLWQDIFEKELTQTASLDPRTRLRTISSKIISLGRTYAGTERYFPLAFLILYMERRSCELNFDTVDLKFVFRAMQEIGITIPRLQEIYDRLFKSKDSCWKSLRKPFHLLFVIHQLLDTFAQSPSTVPAYEKRAFTTICLDSVCHYLVELQAEASSDSVRTLTSSFKSLQAQLERLS